jgi:hypothetical protein
MKIIDAARLMYNAYYDKPSLAATESISLAGVEAHFVRSAGAFIIEGTNSLKDWFQYNFNLFIDAAVTRGDSGALYHAGFYNHAMRAYAFAKPFREEIRVVIGHSLGAASAQIVGPSLGKPTIAFASPRPLLRGDAVKPNLVTNFCREDDLICRLPPGAFSGLLGYQHVGAVVWLSPSTPQLGEDHRIDEYIDIFTNEMAQAGEQEIEITG